MMEVPNKRSLKAVTAMAFGTTQHFRFVDRGVDYTFQFHEDGKATIIDNATNRRVMPKELRGASLEFFAKKNIQIIKQKLYGDRDAG